MSRTDEIEAADVMDHLEKEVARLAADRDKALAQVRAEQEHNKLLVKACGWYRSAAHTALGYMREVTSCADDGNPVTADGSKQVVTDIIDDIADGDKILLPTTKEV